MPKNIFRNGTKSRESLPLRNEENRNHPPKGLQEETQGICPTATAPNHGNHCRCGARRFEKQPHKGPQDGTLGICLTATAPNHGNRCRCGTRRIEKRPPKGLQDGTQGICPTATAPNHGNRCRCGTKKIETSRQKACRKRHKESARPQRHRITGITAAAERGESKNDLQKAYWMGTQGICLPLRHRNIAPPRIRKQGRYCRNTLQRCTRKAGKRFTFAIGQCRKHRHRRCSNGRDSSPLQRCTLKAGKRFTFAIGQCRKRRHRPCGNGQERTPKQR